MIEEGIAFCPHCGAPQIRVIPPEGEDQGAAQPMTGESSTPQNVPPPSAGWTQGGPVYPSQPASSPPPGWTQPGTAYPPLPPTIRWELAWKGALLSGIGAAILTAIPIVSLGCCLWMLGAGALAVSWYSRRVPEIVVTPGMGMKIGALGGVFGALLNALAATLKFVVLGSMRDFHRAMEQQMQKQMSGNQDPKVQEMMQRMIDWIATPQGAATMMVVSLAIMAIVFVVFMGAGGALGASMLGRKREFR